MAKRKGTAFEEETREKHGFQWTQNSGAIHGDADLRHKTGRFIVECKDDKRHEGISISGDDLLKMQQQALTYGDSNWIRFIRNKKNQVVVAMNEDLFHLLMSIADGKIVCPKCEARIQPDW